MAITTLNNLSINRSDTAAADNVWTATSATATDFQAAAAGGKLGQVIQTIKTDIETTTSTTFADCPGMTVAITPVATTSKVLICVHAMMDVHGETGAWKVVDGDGADLTNPACIGDAAGSRFQALGPNLYTGSSSNREKTCTCMILHSPSSTSEETYKIVWYAKTGGYSAQLNYGGADTDSADFGRFASTITVMEILA